MPKTVGVAVSNATFHFDKLYTYAVMPDQQDTVRLGSMVLVPFGRGSRARMGVVLACDAEPESAKLKFLFDVAPASACLTPELLELLLGAVVVVYPFLLPGAGRTGGCRNRFFDLGVGLAQSAHHTVLSGTGGTGHDKQIFFIFCGLGRIFFIFQTC